MELSQKLIAEGYSYYYLAKNAHLLALIYKENRQVLDKYLNNIQIPTIYSFELFSKCSNYTPKCETYYLRISAQL